MSIDINEELREACCQGDLDHVQKLIKAGVSFIIFTLLLNLKVKFLSFLPFFLL